MSLILSEETPRFYGRRKGRKLSKASIMALKEASKCIIEFDKVLENFFNLKKKSRNWVW